MILHSIEQNIEIVLKYSSFILAILAHLIINYKCFKTQCCNYAIKIGQLGFPLNNVIKLNDAKKKKIVTIITNMRNDNNDEPVNDFLILVKNCFDYLIWKLIFRSSIFVVCSSLSLSLPLHRLIFEKLEEKFALFSIYQGTLYPFQVFSSILKR